MKVKLTYSPRCTMNVADTLTASREETNISPNSSVSFCGSTMFTYPGIHHSIITNESLHVHHSLDTNVDLVIITFIYFFIFHFDAFLSYY